jgi:ribokinase
MFDIITVGSATIDIFVDTGDKLFKERVPFGDKVLIDKFHIDTGGGATNTAVAFSRLGFDVGCLAKIGKGSQEIFDVLEKEGVDTSLLVKDLGVATEHSIILDTTGKDRTILVHKDASLKFDWSEVSKDLKTKWFYLASMPVEFLENFISLGAKIALNTSQYLAEKRPAKLLDVTDILVLNKEEAELLGNDIKRAKIVVITDKDNPVRAYSKGKEYTIEPHKNVKAVERTGAGDAFAAGFVSGIIKTGDIEKALKLALLNSESVIGHYGAKNKLLTWEEAKDLL